jgi:hypothetical protein
MAEDLYQEFKQENPLIFQCPTGDKVNIAIHYDSIHEQPVHPSVYPDSVTAHFVVTRQVFNNTLLFSKWLQLLTDDRFGLVTVEPMPMRRGFIMALMRYENLEEIKQEQRAICGVTAVVVRELVRSSLEQANNDGEQD